MCARVLSLRAQSSVGSSQICVAFVRCAVVVKGVLLTCHNTHEMLVGIVRTGSSVFGDGVGAYHGILKKNQKKG